MSSQKVIFITDTDNGVGFETARDLIHSSDDYPFLIGSHSAENGRKANKVFQALSGVKGAVESVTIDVTDDPSIQAAAKDVEQKHGHLGCLINDSGIFNDTKISAEQIRENLAASTISPVIVTDIFLHLLKKFHKHEGDKIKIRGGNPGWLATDLANAETMRKLEESDPSIGAEQFAKCARGQRDLDVGKVVGTYGIGKWQKLHSLPSDSKLTQDKLPVQYNLARAKAGSPSLTDASEPSDSKVPQNKRPVQYNLARAKARSSSLLEGRSDKIFHNVSQDLPHLSSTGNIAAPNDDPSGAPGTLPPTSASESTPPDGGLQAWLVVLGSWCAFFTCFGWSTSIGVFQSYYQQQPLSNYTPSTVAWIPSTELSLMLFGGIVFGHFFDTFGPRYVLLTGSLMHVFGLMMTSLGTEYYQFFLAQSVCSAIGVSAIFNSCASSVSTWFAKRRSTAFGVISSGASVGGIIFPIMVERLIPRIGFAWTMRSVAFLILGLLIVTNLTVRSRRNHDFKSKPLLPSLSPMVKPLREPPFLLLVFAMFFFSFGTFLPFNFLILQAEGKGMSADLSNYLISILNAASLPGRVIPGVLADHLGRFNTMTLTSLISSILVLALWLPSQSNVAIICFAAFYGCFSGAYVSLGPSLIAELSPIEQIGVRNGTIYFFVAVAVLVGNPIGGALVADDDAGRGFVYLQIFSGCLMGVGAAFFLMVRLRLGGWGWKNV